MHIWSTHIWSMHRRPPAGNLYPPPFDQDGQHPGTVDYSVWLTGVDSSRSIHFWIEIQPPKHLHAQATHTQHKKPTQALHNTQAAPHPTPAPCTSHTPNTTTSTPNMRGVHDAHQPHGTPPRVTGVYGGVLEVSLSTLSVASAELSSITARMPDWTSVVQYETFQTVLPL